MGKDQHRENWLDQAQPSLAEWEARLQPKRSSSAPLVLLAVLASGAVILGTAWGLRNFHGSAPAVPNSQVRSTAPPYHAPAAAQPGKSVFPAARTERVERFARCVSASGTVAYTDQPCRKGERAGFVELRPDSNLADGMSVEARQASNSSSAVAAQQLAAHERRVAMNVTQAGSECPQLDLLIAALDAAARLPHSAAEQDRLREQRKQARDKQFALRCA